jgi:two-component system sensor histidine kinase HydH
VASYRKRNALLSAVAGLAFAVVIALIWTMVLRERATRRLYLEYEAFRASAALLEAYRESPTAVSTDGRVLGFGLYKGDGSALVRRGSAPLSLDPAKWSPDYLEARDDSFVLSRPLGPGTPGMPGMPGMGRMGKMRNGMPGMPPGVGQFGDDEMKDPDPAFAPGSQPRSLWMEYGLGGFNRDQAILYGGAAAASLALAVLYAIFLASNRRNGELAERENKNRELVQLGEAARTLVHEIKNPLGIIRVQAASLRRLDPATAVAKAAEKGELIDEEVERLAGLADRIREFLKGGEGKPRDLELAPWLEEFAARYGTGGEGIELAIGAVSRGAAARIDPERLSLALDNLVRNAREAAPEGRPRLSLGARGRHWELSVEDRGPGVPPDQIARLCEPFFTTKAKGSGIGLALSRRVARAAGGELEYRPRAGGGAIFSILLPSRK